MRPLYKPKEEQTTELEFSILEDNKVVLDYNNKTYKLYDNLGNRIGIGNPIKWYEFVNP